MITSLTHSNTESPAAQRSAFTLIELLVVIAIIALLIAILVPSLARAKGQARTVVCSTNLRLVGHGILFYQEDFNDALVPSRLPKQDNCNTHAQILGATKFRPTFMAMLATSVGAPPFEDPQPCKDTEDRFGEPGDKQNYVYAGYYCTETPEWTDERNGSYGYNYQYLGNSRLKDENNLKSYKNWVRRGASIHIPSNTVAAADSMGTAASWPTAERMPYEDDSRDADRFGNEGFNLDPPIIGQNNGESANYDDSPPSRTAIDPRHYGRSAVVWLDGHVSTETFESLGYHIEEDGVVSFSPEEPDASNALWSGSRNIDPWTESWKP